MNKDDLVVSSSWAYNVGHITVGHTCFFDVPLSNYQGVTQGQRAYHCCMNLKSGGWSRIIVRYPKMLVIFIIRFQHQNSGSPFGTSQTNPRTA